MDDFEEYGVLIIDEDADIEDNDRKTETETQDEKTIQEQLTFYFDRIEALFNDALGIDQKGNDEKDAFHQKATEQNNKSTLKSITQENDAVALPNGFSENVLSQLNKSEEDLYEHEKEISYDDSLADADLYSDLFLDEISIARNCNKSEVQRKNTKESQEKVSDNGTFDLYSDILTDELTEKKTSLDELENKCENFSKENVKLQESLQVTMQQNVALKKNISSLFKTAKLEMHRKDQEIHQLRARLDDLLFRRSRPAGSREKSDYPPHSRLHDTRSDPPSGNVEHTKSTNVVYAHTNSSKGKEKPCSDNVASTKLGSSSSVDPLAAKDTSRLLTGYHRKNSISCPKPNKDISTSTPAPENSSKKEVIISNDSYVVRCKEDICDNKPAKPIMEKFILSEGNSGSNSHFQYLHSVRGNRAPSRYANQQMKTRTRNSSSKSSYASRCVQKLRREFTRSRSRTPCPTVRKNRREITTERSSYSKTSSLNKEEESSKFTQIKSDFEDKKDDNNLENESTKHNKEVIRKIGCIFKPIKHDTVSLEGKSNQNFEEQVKLYPGHNHKTGSNLGELNHLGTQAISSEIKPDIHLSVTPARENQSPCTRVKTEDKFETVSHCNSEIVLVESHRVNQVQMSDQNSKKCNSPRTYVKGVANKSKMNNESDKPKKSHSNKSPSYKENKKMDLDVPVKMSSRKRLHEDNIETIFQQKTKVTKEDLKHKESNSSRKSTSSKNATCTSSTHIEQKYEEKLLENSSRIRESHKSSHSESKDQQYRSVDTSRISSKDRKEVNILNENNLHFEKSVNTVQTLETSISTIKETSTIAKQPSKTSLQMLSDQTMKANTDSFNNKFKEMKTHSFAASDKFGVLNEKLAAKKSSLLQAENTRDTSASLKSISKRNSSRKSSENKNEHGSSSPSYRNSVLKTNYRLETKYRSNETHERSPTLSDNGTETIQGKISKHSSNRKENSVSKSDVNPSASDVQQKYNRHFRTAEGKTLPKEQILASVENVLKTKNYSDSKGSDLKLIKWDSENCILSNKENKMKKKLYTTKDCTIPSVNVSSSENGSKESMKIDAKETKCRQSKRQEGIALSERERARVAHDDGSDLEEGEIKSDDDEEFEVPSKKRRRSCRAFERNAPWSSEKLLSVF